MIFNITNFINISVLYSTRLIMGARCETISRYVLPVFRALVAKELINTYKLTQLQAAKKLGTTQAAISQYLNSKRAFKSTEQFGNIMPKLQIKAKETAKLLAENKINSKKATIDFCKICSMLKEEKKEKN